MVVIIVVRRRAGLVVVVFEGGRVVGVGVGVRFTRVWICFGFGFKAGSRRIQNERKDLLVSDTFPRHCRREMERREEMKRGRRATYLLLIGMILGTRRRHYYRRSTESADTEPTSVEKDRVDPVSDPIPDRPIKWPNESEIGVRSGSRKFHG